MYVTEEWKQNIIQDRVQGHSLFYGVSGGFVFSLLIGVAGSPATCVLGGAVMGLLIYQLAHASETNYINSLENNTWYRGNCGGGLTKL